MESHCQSKLNRQKAIFSQKNPAKTMELVQCYIMDTSDRPAAPVLAPENFQARLDWAKRNYEFEMEVSRRLDDDTIPCLWPMSSTAIFSEAFGGKVFYPTDNTPCGIHFISTPEEADQIRLPRLEDTNLMYYFDLADALVEFGGPDAILRLPDIQDPVGVAGIMWDKSELLCNMLEEPDCVLELLDKICTLEEQFLDQWFRRYGSRFATHCPNFVLEQGLSLSCDEVGLVSPDLFRKFFLPNLNRLSDRYGGIAMHCCADSEHQLENFTQIHGLQLLNLNRPKEIRRRAYGLFRSVCVQCHSGFQDGVCQCVGLEEDGMIPAGSRVCYTELADTMDDARRKLEQYRERFLKTASRPV